MACPNNDCQNTTCFDCANIGEWMPSGCSQTYLSEPVALTDTEIILAPGITVRPFGLAMFTGTKISYTKTSTGGCTVPIPCTTCHPAETVTSTVECTNETEIVMYCSVEYRVVNGVTYPVLQGLVRGINPFNCDFLQGEAQFYKSHDANEVVLLNDHRIPKYDCMAAYCLEQLMCKIKNSI